MIIWVYDDSKYCDGSGVDIQNFDLKELLLTIVFTWKYQIKIVEKLFELFFLIFAQFIQIDAIVGGYESEPHGNALIKRLINNSEFLLIVISESQHSVNK